MNTGKTKLRKTSILYARIRPSLKDYVDKQAELETGGNVSEFITRVLEKVKKDAGKDKRVL